MPSFVYPSLLWGLAIVGVPVVIHFITVLRHRRVAWAAMEFLLASEKRNRTRVRFRQLLLLLLRMLVIALIVLVLAEPMARNRLGRLFGGSKTHHVVLLDDSFSMSDRWGDTSAFGEAKRAIDRIAVQLGRRPDAQAFTLLRFSRAGGKAPEPDLFEEAVGPDFSSRLQESLDGLAPSHTAAGPREALEAILAQAGQTKGEQRVVYLVSDFRAREWTDPSDLRGLLTRLNHFGTRLYLIDCVDRRRANLAIEEVSPGAGTRAAGVPLFMEVTVRNFGRAPVVDVPVILQTDGHPQPAATIPRIPPGEAVKERFAVRFPVAGEHVITAQVDHDAVAADNSRSCVVDFPDGLPVLLIDGAPEGSDARYLSAALAPGGPVATGIRPQIERPRYLSRNALGPFEAVYLLNIERLDQAAIDAVEQYLAAGGGVGVFLGPRCRVRFINESLFRNGEGFFPVPLAGQRELLVDRLERAPDIQVQKHPIFRVFLGKRNDFLSTVSVSRYFAAAEAWEKTADTTARTIARLRNGAPLAVERAFAKGRVVAFLTTAGPEWNNWARGNPSFVVTMLELQSHLSKRLSEAVAHPVGAPVELALDPSQHGPQVRFLTPDAGALPVAVDAIPSPDGSLSATLQSTGTAGVYRAALARKDGVPETRHFAVNVEAAEGDLAVVGSRELAVGLSGVEYEFGQAAQFKYSAKNLAGYNLRLPLLYLLILFLVGEQVLAYLASYHPASRQGVPVQAVRGGGH